MAVFNKFNCFVQDLGRGVHNLHVDTLKVALTNTFPVAANTVIGDIVEISAGNGYSTGGIILPGNTFVQTAGVAKLNASDAVLVASGGSIGPFRYLVLYNSDNGALIAWYDYGSSKTLDVSDVLAVDVHFTNGLLTLT